ncbi:MAG: thioredoxin family protein [Odoribacteraceae bacterium]|jgi:thiol-disulfide isomerase/thioredoxin|nr:thioredoxin family protein [Odoribacteraceae bacterium]
MKRLLFIVLVACAACTILPAGARDIHSRQPSPDSTRGIRFLPLSLDEATRLAGEQDKLVFVDCYTSWCGPCKQMANVVFPREEAGDFFNPRFVSVKFDMERGEGKEIATRYAVDVYPTFLLLAADGQEINRVIGSAPLESFIEKVAAAIAPRNDMATLAAEHAGGKMSKERTRDFILRLRDAYRDSLVAVVTDELMRRLDEQEKCSPGYWPLFRDARIVPVSSPHFLFLLDNLAAFEQAVGKEEVARRLKGFRGLDEYLASARSYREGNREKRFLLDHAQALYFSRDKSREIADELFRALDDNERVDTTYWPLFHLLAFNEWGMERFDYLLEHREAFYRTRGQQAVDQTIRHTHVYKLMMIIKGYDKSATVEDLDRMSRQVAAHDLPALEPLIAMTRAYARRDPRELLDACREAFPLFDDNLALNVAPTLVVFLRENLPGEQREEFSPLLSGLITSARSDVLKRTLARLLPDTL